MNDTSKLNNYHFGRHVFEYFPWYTYDNLDINNLPKLDDNFRTDFNSAFYKDLDNMILVWIQEGTGIYASIGIDYTDYKILRVENGILTHEGIEEEVYDWEDIEKIRLRYLLGTKEKADKYFKVINFYNEYHGIISDMVYMQTGEDIEIPVIGIRDFIQSGNEEVCLEFIEPTDIYKCVSSGNFRNTKFMDSIYTFYNKNKFLTNNQINVVRKILYPDIVKSMSSKPLFFFYIKTNMMSNTDRIIKYFDEIKIKYKIFTRFMLVYIQ